jgi:signal transduction histidine kinase
MSEPAYVVGSRTLSEKGKILVVDDEQEFSRFLARKLERHGYAVTCLESGIEALELAREQQFDLILLDMIMPETDGLQVLSGLRAQVATAETPVIVTTGCGQNAAEAFEAGCDDFVRKPIDIRILLARMGSQIARNRAQQNLRELNRRLNETVKARTRHLQDIESQLSNVADNLPAVLWRLELDDDGVWRLMFIHGALGVLGAQRPSIGAPMDVLDQLYHPEDRQLIKNATREMLAGGRSVSMDARLLLEDGSTRWVHVGARVRDGDLLQIDGIHLDVHERKNLETQLLHTQKLESVGQLASGIAHEINSPAQYTRDNIAFLRESFDDLIGLLRAQEKAIRSAGREPLSAGQLEEVAAAAERADLDFLLEEIPGALSQSLDGIDRISRIVNAMKGFTHPGGEEPESCDLNRLIEDTVTIARNEWKYVAELELDLDADMPFVQCHSGELGQVILNLIVNAAHAIAEARAGQGELGRIDVRSRYDAKLSCVEIRISDDGPGVPDHLKTRIFDPFFTTKPVGKGTGQGLAIASSVIADKHGGTLLLDESVSQGATFVISIPA